MPSTPVVTSSRRRFQILAGLAAVLIIPALAASPASASTSAATSAARTTGWLRLAHLSPDTGAVDVWLSPFGGASPGAATLPDVTYGNVSAYRSVAPGRYTVAMRPAGSPASTPAMLTQTVQVVAGKAYSVLAVGPTGGLALQVVPDDLTAPGAALSRVRLIQASTSTGAVEVRAVSGPVLVQDAAYGLVSSYSEVPQGRWTLQVAGSNAGSSPTTTQVDLRAGSVTTLLVLNSATSGGVVLKSITDASAAAVLPTGGVETGEGGTAGSDGSDGLASVRALVSVLLGLLVAGSVLARRRRLAPVPSRA